MAIRRCKINFKGEVIDVKKDILSKEADLVTWSFYEGDNFVGGFSVTKMDKSTSFKPVKLGWNLKSEKYNRYYLKKMADMAEEKMSGVK